MDAKDGCALRTWLLRIAAWLAAIPYVVVFVLVIAGPATWSGVAYVLALGAIIVGLATLPLRGAKRPRRRGVTRGGVAALAAVACMRCCTANDGESMHLTDARGASPRLVDRLLDEADVAVAGTRVLTMSGLLRDDARELPTAMQAAYAEMRHAEGDAPSPVIGTYLGLQRPSAFDLVVIDPPEEAAAHADVAVVFLHGFAGAFDLPCWQMARAVGPLGIVTACPSTRWLGDWWSADGQAILRRTVDFLRSRGVSRVVLAGLSNGGHGASLLATRMRGTFSALVLISGAAADAQPPGIPVLVIHGTKDTMASSQAARAYAARSGARFVALDAGHFAMLVRGAEHDGAVRDFIRTHLGLS
ncbi:MAG TPA: hypothetical protein VM925_04150 [Labilithrix sp.]|nr:hypothetical protein [Labilithrix sp.]